MNKKNKSTIFVTISLVTALVCIAITFWGNWKNDGILTTDAYLGIIATFIGACATIIVGAQIVNHLELRNMQTSLKAIEDEREKIKQQQEAFSMEMYNTRLGIGNALTLIAFTAQKNNDIVTEFNSRVLSIIIDDWSSMKGIALLSRYKRLVDIADSVIQHSDIIFLESTYKTLSILVVPESIEHYDEIMALHYKLLSELKKHFSKQSSGTGGYSE